MMEDGCQDSAVNSHLSFQLGSKNIEFQGHVIKEARYFDEDMSELPIVFNDSGKEYGFDIPHDIISMAELENLSKEEPETSICRRKGADYCRTR